MRLSLRWSVVALLLCLAIQSSLAQEAIAPLPTVLIFHLQRDETKTRYSIQVQSDGLGSYWEGQPDFALQEAVAPRKISVGATSLAKIFAAVSAVKSGGCETHSKNIAQTGQKTFVLMATGTPRCTFNYSDNETVNEATKTFQAIAQTLSFGDKLVHDKRFDHLGLNADLEALATEAKDGSAIELQNIAPILQSIADDDELMGVVQRKAQSLLQDATLKAAK